MYAALWRVLPGPWWTRALIIIFAVTMLVIACVMFIFPWIDQTFFAPADPSIDTGVVDPEVPGDTGDPVDDGEGTVVDDGDGGSLAG